jgi:hypothetical protein
VFGVVVEEHVLVADLVHELFLIVIEVTGDHQVLGGFHGFFDEGDEFRFDFVMCSRLEVHSQYSGSLVRNGYEMFSP